MKISKKIWTILAITVITTTCLLIQTPNNSVYAEIDYQEKVLTASRDITGINIDKYDITVYSAGANPFDYEKIPRYDIALMLTSKENQLLIIAQFINNYLTSISLDVRSGSPSTIHYVNKLSSDPLVATREFLSRLQVFTGNPSITEMQQILESAKDINDVANKTVGNIVCDVRTYLDPITHVPKSIGVAFRYTWNGVASSKVIGVRFEDGLFSGFGDSWEVYSVADVALKVTREQAIGVAREQAISAAGSVSLEFPSEDRIVAELRVASRDGLVLYPYWFVELPLIYSPDSGVNAWQLSIWADTGEIVSSHPTGGYGVVSDGSDSSTFNGSLDVNTSTLQSNKYLLPLAALIIAIVLISLIAVFKKR